MELDGEDLFVWVSGDCFERDVVVDDEADASTMGGSVSSDDCVVADAD